MKRHSLRNKIVAGTLALTLLAGLVPKSAEALPTPQKRIGIKKVLTLPDRAKTPIETFTFSITPHSKDGSTDKVGKVPTLSPNTVSVSYTVDDVDAQDQDDQTPGKQVVKKVDNIYSMFAKVEFNAAGQYTYTVKEEPKDPLTGGMTYSKAEYLVSVFVEKDENDKFVIKNIYVKQDKTDIGEDAGNGKVEVTPQAPGAIEFNNAYEAPKTDFTLKKTVAGIAPPASSQTPFKFSLTVSKPEGSTATEFKYRISSKTSQETGTYGTPIAFTLKHGESINLTELEAGSSVKAEETDAQGYSGSIGTDSIMAGQKTAITVESLETGMILGVAGENVIDYVNTQQTPTGVVIDNLPFIALALMAGMGLVFFVKNRRQEEFDL